MNTAQVNRQYREAFIRNATSVELVITMYDMMIEDLNRAIHAVMEKDIDKRTSETKHILSVLEQLQGTLNMNEGGDAATDLNRFYSIMRCKLLEANIKNSVPALQELITELTHLKTAWQQVESGPRLQSFEQERVDCSS